MLRVGWERNLSGSEASYTDGSSYVSKLFPPPLSLDLWKWKVVGSFAALNGGVFFPSESLNGPDQFQLCCSWVDPSFTFPGAVGGSLVLRLDLASLLCFIKENKWIHVKQTTIPFFLRLPLTAEICGGVGSVCKYRNV